jgi:16S rRNA (guanine966-N2)-methyltransferase
VRVIGGSLKGRKLASVRGMAIRPTADRVREALFNILGPRPADAHVLDLFAGTGALGIEALSRGARQALFVDNAAQALKMLRKNIEICRLESRSRVVQWDIAKNLNMLHTYPHKFDLVLIDPPYDQGMIAPTLVHLAGSRSLAPGALIVVEHAPSERIDAVPAQLAPGNHRRYGQTQLSFFHFHG